MTIEKQKIALMFDYMSAGDSSLQRADGAFVFCRADPLVAERASELYADGLVGYMLFTGGVGKDSGYLAHLGIPEAAFQGALAHLVHRVPEDKIYLEVLARNGGENCRNGIDMIIERQLVHDRLTLVSHATSLLRCRAMFENEAQKKSFYSKLYSTPTLYSFDPNNPIDQKEAVSELLRLAQWPAKGWCMPQTDLSLDLVEYAKAVAPELGLL